MKQLLRVLTRTKCRLWEVVFVSFVLGYLRQAYYFALQIYNAACEWFAKSRSSSLLMKSRQDTSGGQVFCTRGQRRQRKNQRAAEMLQKRQRLQALRTKQKLSQGNAPHSYPPDPRNTHQSHICRHNSTSTHIHASLRLHSNKLVSSHPAKNPLSSVFLRRSLAHTHTLFLISSPARHNLHKPPAVCIWQDTFSAIPSATYFSTNNNRLKLQCIVSCYVSLLIGSSSQSQLLIQIFNSSTHFQTTHIQPTELTRR